MTLSLPGPIGAAATRFIAQARGRGDRNEARDVAAHAARRVLLAAFATTLVAVVISSWLLQPPLPMVIATAFLGLGASGQAFVRGVHYGCSEHTRSAFWDVVAVILGVAGVVFTLLLGGGAVGIVFSLAGACWVQLLVGWPWLRGGRPSHQVRREVDTFAVVSAVGSLGSAVFFHFSIVVAGVVAGDAGAGEYQATLVLATPLLMLTNALSLVTFPNVAEAIGRGDVAYVMERTAQNTRLVALALGGCVASVALAGGSLVPLIWGGDFSEVDRILPVVLIAVLATGMEGPSVSYLMSRSQGSALIVMVASLGGFAIGGLIWLATTPSLGLLGVALGYAVGKVCTSSVVLIIAFRHLRLDLAWFAARLAGGTILVGLILWQGQRGGPTLWDLAEVGAFLSLWTITCRQDLGTALRLVRRR